MRPFIPLLFATAVLSAQTVSKSVTPISVGRKVALVIGNSAYSRLDPIPAALEAGVGRIRPVLMTALAMIIGMLPMSLGLGEGGEQNAPLARAVIGGLFIATVATLFFVPAVFSIMHRQRLASAPAAELDEFEPEPELAGA